MPKDGFVPNKNPGPGDYKEGSSIAEVSQIKAKY
jgi:hypothetical protein